MEEEGAMQDTRERILDILKERHQATVDELSRELGLTAVTVRHHLDVLRGEGYVAAPIVRRRKTPGRPQYAYALTDKASTFFPKRYGQLASLMLDELRSCLSPAEVDQMMKRIGERIASQAVLPDEGDFEARLAAAVDFLDELGYMARWERRDSGDYLLRIANCPYEQVAGQHDEVCKVDLRMLTRLLGTAPQRITWAAQGDHDCTYSIRPPGG
jgi:DeoR family suf operon transcriptional repressor